MLSSPFSSWRRSRRNWQAELVNVHVDGLVRGKPRAEALLAGADRATAAEARELFAVAERVNRALVPVQPDERFVRGLYESLRLAEPPRLSVLQRLHHLPLRTRLAAAGIGGAATLTVTAGVVWIALRSEGGLLGALRRRMPAA